MIPYTYTRMEAPTVGLAPATPRRLKSEGERFESIAFTFCKAATICLIAGKFALPAAAGLTSAFYVLAYVKGKRDTRCILKYPLIIAAFWTWVGAVALYAILNPGSWQAFLNRMWPWGR